MTPTDDASPQAGYLPYWTDQKLGGARTAAQVRLMVDAFAKDDVTIEVHPDRPQDMRYLCEAGVVLTRDEDLPRVYDALGLSRERLVEPQRKTLIAGLSEVQLPDTERSVEEWLTELDARLGEGVCSPNYVVHVSPASCCPAAEPAPATSGPVPDVNLRRECDGEGVLISVVDTGVLPEVVAEHSWLSGVTGDEEKRQVGHYRDHGTFIAGVIRAMAPASHVHVDGLLFVGGGVLESDLVVRLGKALERTPDIVSMSAGTRTRNNVPPIGFQVLYEQRLRHLKGTVLVAAAGNDGDRGPFWPAAFPWAISVGALDADGGRAPYSNHGSWVDVYARGSDVVNAYPNGWYEYREPPKTGQKADFTTGLASWSGTSFATPIVSGLIASRMSRTGESAKAAAHHLLAMAARHARRGIGPILEPGMGCVSGCCGCC